VIHCDCKARPIYDHLSDEAIDRHCMEGNTGSIVEDTHLSICLVCILRARKTGEFLRIIDRASVAQKQIAAGHSAIYSILLGDSVRITAGPLTGLEGVVTGIREDTPTRIRMSVSLLQRSVIIEMDVGSIVPIVRRQPSGR
jgi:hypothetical protein